MSHLPATDQLNAIFAEAIAARIFPGGVVWLGCGTHCLAHKAFGHDIYPGDADVCDGDAACPVTTETVYDIASLTKLFTATALLVTARERGVSLDTPIGEFLPDFKGPAFAAVTVRHLLNHSSGIATHIQALIDFPVPSWPRHIAAAGLQTPAGQRVLYTCTAYYLLGHIVEALCSMPLQCVIEERILLPLQMHGSGYHPLRRVSRSAVAPTEIEPGSGRPLRGVVHDEAARAVEAGGAVSGNAGIFATAADLARFAQLWLQRGAWGGCQIIDSRDVEAALGAAIAGQGYRQGLGWHLQVSSWMGPQAPRGSAGHAGFTGPTLFISPATRHTVIILNNRVYPTRQGPARMATHRRIAAWLFAATATHNSEENL